MFNRKLKTKIKEQKCRVFTLEREVQRLKSVELTNEALLEESLKLVNRVNKAEKKEREQTEADLFFISAKIQDEILAGKRKENIQPLILRQNEFVHQLEQHWND